MMIYRGAVCPCDIQIITWTAYILYTQVIFTFQSRDHKLNAARSHATHNERNERRAYRDRPFKLRSNVLHDASMVYFWKSPQL